MLSKSLRIAVIVLIATANIAAAKSSGIDAKYKEIGAGVLGKPSGGERKAARGGRVRFYGNGAIYSSSATGAHAIHGAAFDKYKMLGSEAGTLGYPVTDESETADGARQIILQHGYIIVGKDGTAVGKTLPSATFANDRVILAKGKATMKNATDALLPEVGPVADGTTFNCSCAVTQRLGTGTCTIVIKNGNTVQCLKGTCSRSCTLTVVSN